MKLSEAGITCEPLNDNALRIQIAASHHRSKAIVPIIVGIILLGGAVGLAFWPLPALMRIFSISLAVFLLFIGGVFGYIAIYLSLVSTEITARRGSLTVQRSVGVIHRKTTYAATDLTEVAAGVEGKTETKKQKALFSSEMERQTTLYYGIFVILSGGNKLWLAGSMFQQDYANELAEELRSAIGPLQGQ